MVSDGMLLETNNENVPWDYLTKRQQRCFTALSCTVTEFTSRYTILDDIVTNIINICILLLTNNKMYYILQIYLMCIYDLHYLVTTFFQSPTLNRNLVVHLILLVGQNCYLCYPCHHHRALKLMQILFEDFQFSLPVL
jgi:hypothetical protein